MGVTEVFLSALAGTVLAQLAPGPNLLAVASVALAQGRGHAVRVAAGVAVGVLGWAAAFAAGLSVVFESVPGAALTLRIVGGLYLLYMAVRALRSAWRHRAGSIGAAPGGLSHRRAFFHGLLVVWTNPKAAMMWAAVSAYLLGSGLPAGTMLGFAPLASVTAMLVYGGYALVFSAGGVQTLYQRGARWLEAAFGCAFGTLGGKLLLDGLREARG